MAKKLIATGYTINASQNQITVPGIIQPVFEALLLELYMHNDLRIKGYPFNKR